MDFNWAAGEEHVYVIGTEEGGIAYSSEYLATYPGHTMATYAARWNRLHPKVLLSASADWTLRVWDARRPGPAGPVLSFDLGDAVGDAAWAPYSSTVMAAVTDDGRAHVFDLAASRLAPLCSQKVTRSGRPTKLAFNQKYPVVLVGDSKGNVTCLKLSPNLRRSSAAAPVAGAGGGAVAGAGVGAAAAGAGAAAAARSKFEAAEQQRLDAVLEVAMKGRAGGGGGAGGSRGGHVA
ncbi:Dynein, intermediate chain, flagellar outer arm [Monoraphidium neglectum]|uniref:Dynein, intermediate chain, flagellar outer arm n=1 Tax=Monoraphidium neglectum TaxID=145388 RepID=A0A0D2IZZ6_9CHLO|nr:Dynein, intermediate chain, flagellar outer arm [Monoraphidium neglectum]KIY93417.1 Dynein, intermediate chain, flagellar outer arm [Monoraphidium neglectum]|eukprot:XP_013892437.1 Dynein, intermediate chain, flagellar outer arm [Monoraphidium neglectum]